jgi:hypothetical protein
MAGSDDTPTVGTECSMPNSLAVLEWRGNWLTGGCIPHLSVPAHTGSDNEASIGAKCSMKHTVSVFERLTDWLPCAGVPHLCV